MYLLCPENVCLRSSSRILYILALLAGYFLKNNVANKKIVQLSANTTQGFQQNFIEKAFDFKNNFICSAISAYIPLAIVYQGSEGHTAVQIRKVLGFDQEDVIVDGRQFLSELNNHQTVTLKVLNKIYLANNANVKTRFINDSEAYFNSNINKIDTSNPLQSANIINNWVSDNTNHKIKDLIDSDEITPDTKIIIINAVYFKGKWAQPFDSSIKNSRFRTFENKNLKVPTMHVSGSFTNGVLDMIGNRFIELPYEGDEFKMIIIVTPTFKDWENVKNYLKLNRLKNSLKMSENTDVELYIPKFIVESTIDAKDVLQSMELTDAFNENADFSKISSEPLKIDKFVQKAFIEVNEEGAEAAAASSMDISTRMGIENEEFRINEPFIFLIVDNEYNDIFMGAVLDPTKK